MKDIKFKFERLRYMVTTHEEQTILDNESAKEDETLFKSDVEDFVSLVKQIDIAKYTQRDFIGVVSEIYKQAVLDRNQEEKNNESERKESTAN